MTDTPIREGLKDAAIEKVAGISTIPMRQLEMIAPLMLDAILSELQEPSEGMIEACMVEAERQRVAFDEMSPPMYFGDILRAAIQHIRDGGR